jgi:hypothetical protein
LESEDYKEYIARLRSFGVPEKIIRDVIMADVQKLYRPRFAALRPPKKPANPNFWETRNQGFYPNRDQTKEQREQTRALQKEQAELIKPCWVWTFTSRFQRIVVILTGPSA